MNDRVVKWGGSLIQHGKDNDRVYLMHLCPADYPGIINQMIELTKENGYSKIFAKIPSQYAVGFLSAGFRMEAFVPQLYQGTEDAFFMSLFFSPERQELPQTAFDNFQLILEDHFEGHQVSLPEPFVFRKAVPADAEAMAELYRIVFQSYPFPIHNPEYLRQTMAEKAHTRMVYFTIWDRDHLAALSSAEIDPSNQNVEMTDFAVKPDYRGHKLGLFLLLRMETEMIHCGIKTAYTIARLKSAAMNKTFKNAGYAYSGTLVNNTNISGGLESMNVWYKDIRE